MAKDEVAERLATLWMAQLKVAEVEDDDDFLDSGGTSIAAVHLAASIQENFGVAIDALEIVMTRTFGGIAGLISERLSSSVA